MANIDTFIKGNIEDKTKKVTLTSTSVPSSSWTDAQYPSARALLLSTMDLLAARDRLHPVGSTWCMSTNTNPAAFFGGTWELIDKSFRHTTKSITEEHWIGNNSYIYNSGQCAGKTNKIYLYDKTIMISLNIVNTSEATDTDKTLGKLNYIALGLHPQTFFGIPNNAAQGDGWQARVCYTFSDTGSVVVHDALFQNAAGTHRGTCDEICFTIKTTLVPEKMPDALCNKFVFKRVA